MNFVLIIFTGLIFGAGAVLLVANGNPGNYGFCAACHLRDIAGALGIHPAVTLQYIRPEVLGWIIGAFALSRITGQFRPRGGSKPLVRFVLGIMMMLGALVFLGCPLRGILRLAAGDLNGITGLAGFVVGIGVGIVFLKQGYNLGRAKAYGASGSIFGYGAVAVAVVLLIAVIVHAPFLNFSVKGPGSMHAPIFLSLLAGLIAGGAAWRTRMCLSGGIRDFILVRDTYLLKIYLAIFAAAFLANLYFGFFKLGFNGQPLAHTMHLWNFLSMLLVGITATLAGGCPLRQIIMAGEGSTDAMMCILGMLVGAGIAHSLNTAGSPAGVSVQGQVAVIIGLVITGGIGWAFRENLASISRGV